MSLLELAVDNTDVIKHNQAVVYEIEKQITMGEAVPLFKAYNMLNKEGLTLQVRKKVAELYGMNTTELKGAFAALERSEQLSQDLGCVPDNEYEFMNALMKKWDTTMKFQKIYTVKTSYKIDEKEYHEEDLDSLGKELAVFIRGADPKTFGFAEMMAKVIKANSEMDMGYTEQKVIRALEDWTDTQRNHIVATAKMNITYSLNSSLRAEAEWDKLVAAITEVNVPETKVVLKHFIWQIKRKMFNKHVDKHMMPVLVGLQEIGKSTIVKKILEPIEEFTITTNFKDITDGRSHDLWKNYVLILDEMGNSTQSNIEEIKQKITSDTFSSRVMKTNNDAVIVNNTTMIGTSNKDLSRLIFDDTGMRRFFQITCLSWFDRAVVNSINYQLLWQSIDEQAKTPLSDEAIAASVRTLQNEKRYKSLLEMFFEDREYKGGQFGEVVGSDDLYQEFRVYEESHQPKAEMTSNKFWRDMIDIPSRIPALTIEKLPRSSAGSRYRLTMDKAGF